MPSNWKIQMKWFGKKATEKADPVAELTHAIERLQAGILTNLTVAYSSRMPPTDALPLAMCVLSYTMLVAPVGDSAKVFQANNAALVQAEALKLSDDEGVRTALSYLYASLTMLIAIRTRNPLSDAALHLGNRATEFSIHIPNTYDICGSDDAITCIAALSTYAKNYARPASDTEIS